MSDKHFVARIVVEKVVRSEANPTDRSVRGQVDSVVGEKRRVTELTSITVKANSLESALAKASSHLSLIDDIDAEDPKPGATR